ncbi:MAG: 2-C-methyl-D-erythritol 4-phosphate cytidylyltransferase [Flavobacteriales bacterium]|nr:2-C-methyl-D-erythritol 4-phosphate cytidylyltransferase [Flavobacteriales bacterium]MBO72140.1 2-C-methyl-D-erythritol 4-phosphate cytidylyltransferase [Flavobacteriales bacterium]|tara:strand:- start:451 stop:1107 length:657 start_codon:yes stop_codon:yes gene_type:complete
MNSIVIVAGGKGKRMGSNVPKQFLVLKNEPVIMHTIRKFYNWDNRCEIVLVLPFSQKTYWENLVKEYNFNIPVLVTSGGNTRFHSVKNGLSKTSGDVIGIHDGVRPLVSEETIKNCFDVAKKEGNATPCLPINDSLRIVENNANRTVDRSKFYKIQTPQVFQRSVLLKAFEQEFAEEFTDDASVVEKTGEVIQLIKGNEENIKITRPFDLKIAEVFLK